LFSRKRRNETKTKMDDDHRTVMDRFADPLDSSFIPFVSHPVGEYGESPREDFGGLLERLCLFDYQDFMPNPVCRGLQCMMTTTKDYVPNVDARFVFAVILSLEVSVQDLIQKDLESYAQKASTPLERYSRESKAVFFRDEYLRFVKQTIGRLMESNFDQRNAQDLLEMTLTKLQATWVREDMAEIIAARAHWSEMDLKDSQKVRRSTAERSSEKKRTNNQRNQERKDFNRQLMSGEAEYWKKIPTTK
jgi:hypothetical protein